MDLGYTDCLFWVCTMDETHPQISNGREAAANAWSRLSLRWACLQVGWGQEEIFP